MSQSHASESSAKLLQPLTSFVGRRREIAELRQLIEATRLLTITGAGGAGKTRLAVQVAHSLADRFADRVYLVTLEALTDPALITRQLATELGVREEPDHALIDTLIACLGRGQTLVVIDNCEHLAVACAALAEQLLRACAGLRILATSRQPLGVAGETTWRIPSLAVPDPARRPPVERLRQIEAVQLFAERAAATMPGFTVTDQNAAPVADLCSRLDGMPLALELAAVRVRTLGIEQVAARLHDRLRLLTGGSPTALPRQQTLRGTLDWSHDSLDDMERRLLRRLAVFAGGWTLDGAEQVCADEEISAADVVDLLAQLVDKSLIVADTHANGTMRYRLLESIREYAAEKLREADETTRMRRRHATCILALADALGPTTTGPQQAMALEQSEWTSDFFGSLNEVPAEPVAGIADILEAMGTEPGFRAARLALLRDLRLRDGTAVLEAGCGTGVALPDLLDVGGVNLNIVGVDPTEAFVTRAGERAQRLGARHASYQVGDIRALPVDGESSLDAAFCEKVLIHAGPTSAALGELIRVVRPGGRVGALEWYPQFALSTTDPDHLTALNAMFRTICNDYTVAANLARHFQAAGLQDVTTQTTMAHADSLYEHPFWASFLVGQLPMFVHAQVLDASIAEALTTDLERLSARGKFHASFIIRTAVGTKPG